MNKYNFLESIDFRRKVNIIYENITLEISNIIEHIENTQMNFNFEIFCIKQSDINYSIFKEDNIFILDNNFSSIEMSDFIDKVEPYKIYLLRKVDQEYELLVHEYNRYNFKIDGFDIPFSRHSRKIERMFLYEIARKMDIEGSMVEIGSFSGGTTSALSIGSAQSKKPTKLVSIDLKYRDSFDQFIERASITDKVLKNEINSQEFIVQWKEYCKNKFLDNQIKLLFIDGNHTYEGCLADIVNYSQYLVDGGVIILHDYTDYHGDNAGVAKAIEESILKNDEFSNFVSVDSMFYAEKKSKINYLDASMIKRKVISYAPTVKNFYEYLKYINIFKKNIALYGAGRHTVDLLSIMEEKDKKYIRVIIDDSENAPKKIHNISVYPIDKIKVTTIDIIIPSSLDYEKDMVTKLDQLKINPYITVYTNSKFKQFINMPEYLGVNVPHVNTVDELKQILKVKNER